MITWGRSWTQLTIPLVGRGEAGTPVTVVRLPILGADVAARTRLSHARLLTHLRALSLNLQAPVLHSGPSCMQGRLLGESFLAAAVLCKDHCKAHPPATII